MGVIENRRRIIAAQPHLVTASGSAVLVTIAEPKIEHLRVTFSPVQTGSGTPSPDNVRPIMGYATIMASIGTLPVDISLGGTYYGGVVDLVSGVMTVTHYYTDVNQTNLPTMNKYSVANGYWCGQFPINANGLPLPVTRSGISNRFSQTIEGAAGRINTVRNSSGTDGSIYLFLPLSEMSGQDVSDAWAWLTAHPTQVVYELYTPQTVALTPQTIAALRGQQTVTSPAGSVEISYWTH